MIYKNLFWKNTIYFLLLIEQSFIIVMSKIEDIHNAALKIINKQGLYQAPVSQIAKEAGVAAGTMYVYYKSKDQLVISLYKIVLKGLSTSVHDAVQESLDERSRFFKIWLAIFKYYITNPDKFLYLRQFSASPYGKEIGDDEFMKSVEPLARVIGDAIRKGQLKDLPLPLVVSMVMGNIEATVRIQLSGSLQLSGALLQELLTSSWRALEKL